MKYRVRHSTVYSYADAVDLATHMLHLRPRELIGQQVIESGIEISPTPTTRTEGIDHFGNCVTRVSVNVPHRRFEVVSEALVDVEFPVPPPEAETQSWENVASEAAAGGAAYEAAEFTFPSQLVPPVPEARAYALPSFTPDRPVLAALADLNNRIRRDFAFRAGVSTIATPIARTLERREGVCQDFSHMMIAALRGLGLPARYVSGYVRTRPPAGTPRLRGADQSHAWVGAWLGSQHGWVGLDPTNGLIVRDEHVMIGWGRDYNDVSPVRGVILGGGRHGLSVGVDLSPV